MFGENFTYYVANGLETILSRTISQCQKQNLFGVNCFYYEILIREIGKGKLFTSKITLVSNDWETKISNPKK